MMIFDQKQQTLTKRNLSYVAKEFTVFGRKGHFIDRKVV